MGQPERSGTRRRGGFRGATRTVGTVSGVSLHTSIATSKHDHLRELRVQHKGQPYRVLYAFDPRRTAILLIGGKKTGDDRWYSTFVPLADKLYDQHLELLKKEGLL